MISIPFLLGLLSYLFVVVLALIAIPKIGKPLKVFMLIVAILLYGWNYYSNKQEMTQSFKDELIKSKFATIERFQHFNPEQRLRVNIFKQHRRGKEIFYTITYSYNMDNDADKLIEIPDNMGCTGEAWNSKKQVWGDQKRIFEEGRYRVPDEELKKVPADLVWICSTPILGKYGEVMAVINIDGNRHVEEKQKEEIKKHCNLLADELKSLL